MLDHGGLINLKNNLPAQFFDVENESDWCPDFELVNFLPGQKKVQEDHSKYLELTHPGRLQHFTSYCDLTYWKRYEEKKESHELEKYGKISRMSPFARYPKGISIFHVFATEVKVLEAVYDKLVQGADPDDSRLTMLPLMFLHRSRGKQINDKKQPQPLQSPVHIALEKQSPRSFEIMMTLLKDQKQVCVT
jgi:hypothetical protein